MRKGATDELNTAIVGVIHLQCKALLAKDLPSDLADQERVRGLARQYIKTVDLIGVKAQVVALYDGLQELVQSLDKLTNSAELHSLATTWNGAISDLGPLNTALDSVKHSPVSGDTMSFLSDLLAFVLKAVEKATHDRAACIPTVQPALDTLMKIFNLPGFDKMIDHANREYETLHSIIRSGFIVLGAYNKLFGDGGEPRFVLEAAEMTPAVVAYVKSVKHFNSLPFVRGSDEAKAMPNAFWAQKIVDSISNLVVGATDGLQRMRESCAKQIEEVFRCSPSLFPRIPHYSTRLLEVSFRSGIFQAWQAAALGLLRCHQCGF